MRQYVIASVLIILALVAIAYKAALPPGSWQLPYLNDFSSALLVGGLLSILFKIFQERESETTLRRLFRIHDSVDELGLCEIKPEVQAYNFIDIVENADSLCIVMNDGLRWAGNNTVSLQKRFSKKSTTEFFTVDPESPFVDVLATKTSTTRDALANKIREAWKLVEEAYGKSEKRGQLTIYKLKTFPTKSIFITEDILVETPYQTASGRVSIPVFVYKKVPRVDSPYGFVYNDIASLRLESAVHVKFPKDS